MTAYEVTATLPAERDLEELYYYLSVEQQEPQIARQVLSRLRESILSLAEFPTRHPLVADRLLAIRNYRMFVAESMLIIYTVREDAQAVVILRVLHSRRDWMSILK